jgi:GMP synthase (glutamine-hydrolysing)
MICIIDCGTSWLKEIEQHVQDASIVKVDDLATEEMGKYNGVVISGSPIILDQEGLEKQKGLFSFLKDITVPVLAICHGHQMLAHVYGITLEKGEMINKMETIRFLENDPLFSGIPENAVFKEEHFQHVAVPEGFRRLAASESCANEAMRHASKPLYGTQFHPEVSGDHGAQLFRNFLKMCRPHDDEHPS